MERIKKYQKSALAVLTLGMVILVLLSSCDLRRSLTSYFDLPFVKSLNVSKTTVSSSSCDFSENHEVRVITESETPQQAFILPAESVSKVFAFLSIKNIPLYSPPRETVRQIPIYILFKKMKVAA